jgi:hypothetical protein
VLEPIKLKIPPFKIEISPLLPAIVPELYWKVPPELTEIDDDAN